MSIVVALLLVGPLVVALALVVWMVVFPILVVVLAPTGQILPE